MKHNAKVLECMGELLRTGHGPSIYLMLVEPHRRQKVAKRENKKATKARNSL